MKEILILALLSISIGGFAQTPVSVYDCAAYPGITQSDINNTGYEFYRPCVLLGNGQTFDFNGSSNKKISASTKIQITSNPSNQSFHAGNYSSTSSGLQLAITPKSDFDIAVMNYPDLMNVLRYEKLELGVALPQDILTKVNNFVNESTVVGAQKLNPFLDWELKVQATFTYPSGLTKNVDAFYYREMQQNLSLNKWDEIATNYPFRVRVSPPQNGNCVCTIKIFENNVLTHTSNSFTFKVIESGSHGYVKVHSNHKNLELDGNMIYPVGVNLPWAEVGNYMQYGYDKESKLGVDVWNEYQEDVLSYANQGGKYMRILLSPVANGIEFEKLGNYYDRLDYAWELDKTISVCESHGMFIDFNMMEHHEIMINGSQDNGQWDFSDDTPKGNPMPQYWQDDCSTCNPPHYKGEQIMGWDGNPYTKVNTRRYCYQKDFNFQTFSQVIENQNTLVNNKKALDYMKQRYRYIISRWGYSTNIYLFELLSEPWHLDESLSNPITNFEGAIMYDDETPQGAQVRRSVYKFHNELSQYIKITLDHTEHLLVAEGMDNGYTAMPNGLNVATMGQDLSWILPNIDVIGISSYGNADPTQLVNFSSGTYASISNGYIGSNDRSRANNIALLHQTYNKPVLLSEGGYNNAFYPCSDYVPNKLNLAQFGFFGYAGFQTWIGWWHLADNENPPVGTPPHDQRLEWDQTIRTQNTFEGSNVLPILSDGFGYWYQGREENNSRGVFGNKNYLKEHQYYVANNKSKAVGYIYNRTYNSASMINPNYDGFEPCLQITSIPFEGDRTHFYAFENMMQNQGVIHAMGLKVNTDFLIEYYNSITGEYIGGNCKNSNRNGELELAHPDLNINQPIMWYTIKEQNCGKSLRTQTTFDSDNTNFTAQSIDIQYNMEILIYPNPGKNSLNIQLTNELIDQTMTILLLDGTGRIVIEQSCNDGLMMINTSTINSGIYQIQIMLNDELISIHKWVKAEE